MKYEGKTEIPKKKIPKKVKQELWKRHYGEVWWGKCTVSWCTTIFPVLSSEWHAGHNIPESKGGTTAINNLRPICASCNLGMGSDLTIDEWDLKYAVNTLIDIRNWDSCNPPPQKKRKRD